MALRIDSDHGLVLPQYCGPRELIDVWKLNCSRSPNKCDISQWTVSPGKIEELIELCYAASLLQEENKKVQCRLFVDLTTATDWTNAWKLRFESPIPLSTPLVLKKISNSTLPDKVSLCIEEVDGEVCIVGYFKLRRSLEVSLPGCPIEMSYAGLKGMMISVVAPGSLTIGGPHQILELVGGRIQSNFVRVADYPQVNRRFETATQKIFGNARQLFAQKVDPSPLGYPDMLNYSVTSTWQRVIDQVKLKRCGGAFAFVTTESLADVDRKHVVNDFSLGRRLYQLWDKSFDSTQPMEQKQFIAWNEARVQVDAAIDFLVGMSSIDGCVILNEDMTVQAFGCKLRSKSFKSAEQPNIVFRNPQNGALDHGLEERVKLFGTRHRSAFDFCCAHPGTMVVVISEDGDVRIFLRDENTVALVDCKNPPSLKGLSIHVPGFD